MKRKVKAKARKAAKKVFGALDIHLYVKDVDATAAKAVEAGARMMREVQDMFYGDRTGTIEDPFGHFWHVSTHKRDVSPAEMKRKAAEMARAPGG